MYNLIIWTEQVDFYNDFMDKVLGVLLGDKQNSVHKK